MLALGLVVALLSSAASAPDGSDTNDRPLVVRVHSLAGLVENHGHGAGVLSLLPYSAGMSLPSPDVEGQGEEGPAVLSGEDICGLVRELVEPNFWDETAGASNDLSGADRMVVVAPQEVQDKIADFLAHLVTALVPSEQLEVRVLTSQESDAAGGELSLEFAEADRRIAERGLLHRTSAALRGRAVVSADALVRESIVYDWEVEIAQGATIADPVVRNVGTGIELVARSTRVDGGALLNLVVRASDPAGPTTERRVRAKSLVNSKSVMSERVAAGAMQHPEVAFASFAGTLLIPDGRAVWVPVTVVTHRGPVSFCLDLRVTGRATPARSSFEVARSASDEPMRLDFMSRGATDLGRVTMTRIGARMFDDQWTVNEGSQPVWATLDWIGEDGILINLIQRVAAEVLDSGGGSVGYAGDYVRTLLPKSFAERVGAALQPLQRVDAGAFVRGRLLADGEERATFRVPAVLGRPLALWSGIQGTRIFDWDVDVANEAQACNPEPEAWLDGFALQLELSRNAAGGLVLRANGKVCLLEGPPQPLDTLDDAQMTIDQIHARTLFVDELRSLPAAGGKTIFGGDLSLELEVAVSNR